MGTVWLEVPKQAVPLALAFRQSPSLGSLLRHPRPCASPFPTAPLPFRPCSASVPDDPTPGRPPPPPPRAGASSPTSGVAESASGRLCGANGARRDRAGGHGESGPRRCAHRLEPAPAAGAMDRAPAEQVRERPGCSQASGPAGRLTWKAGGGGPGPSELGGDSGYPCSSLEYILFMKRDYLIYPCFPV